MGKEIEMKKDWMARELTMEVIVGVFMVMILLGLTYFTFILSGEMWGKKHYQMEIVFNDVMGLREKDSVVVRGMPIGQIENLSLQADGVHIMITVEKVLKMKADYKITVVATSILGGRYLQIYEGSDDLPVVENMKLFIGEEPYDLMADAAQLVNAAKEGFTDEDGIIANLRDATAQIKDTTTRLNAGEGVLGKLLSKDGALYDDLAESVKALKEITAKIERGEGMLGKLVNDEELYNEVKSVVNEARATLDDFRETSPVISFTSIFFGAF